MSLGIRLPLAVVITPDEWRIAAIRAERMRQTLTRETIEQRRSPDPNVGDFTDAYAAEAKVANVARVGYEPQWEPTPYDLDLGDGRKAEIKVSRCRGARLLVSQYAVDYSEADIFLLCELPVFEPRWSRIGCELLRIVGWMRAGDVVQDRFFDEKFGPRHRPTYVVPQSELNTGAL